MSFTLKPLPYAYDALEPVISKDTLHFHHDKHHQAYVNNLNAVLEGTELEGYTCGREVIKNLQKLPKEKIAGARNNAGGVANHNMYWECMTPGGSKEPVGELKAEMEKVFGSFESFQEQFNKAGAGRFGSGWVWLVLRDGKLAIETTANQDNPVETGAIPLLGNDVWEHAYYLDYQNRRADYLKEWFKLLNWDIIGERYLKAVKGKQSCEL